MLPNCDFEYQHNSPMQLPYSCFSVATMTYEI